MESFVDGQESSSPTQTVVARCWVKLVRRTGEGSSLAPDFATE